MKRAIKYTNCVAAIAFIAMLVSTVARGQGSTESPLLAPTGTYSVGRTEMSWVDVTRVDPQIPSGHYEVAVTIWYPAKPQAEAQPAPWKPGIWGDVLWAKWSQTNPELAKANPFPIHAIRSHSFADAPIVSGQNKFPIVLFFADPTNYTTLVEEVASHGYVVVGLMSSDGAQFTVRADGRLQIVPQTPHQAVAYQFPPESEKRTSELQKEVRLTNGRIVYTTPEEAEAYQANEVSEIATDDWVVDGGVILDQLEKLDADANSRFHGRLDLKKIGSFGHSRGGADSFQLAKEDPRVIAALNLDGSWGEVNQDGGVFKPVMVIEHSDPGDGRANQMRAAHYVGVLRDGKPAYRLFIPNSRHDFCIDFGLLPFLPQESKEKLVGPIGSVRAITITRAYVDAFFGQYLEGKKSALLNGPSSEYPETTFETNNQK